VFVDAFREKSALAERERRRAGELSAVLETLREKEQVWPLSTWPSGSLTPLAIPR
jgi:hypothetical protein